MASRDETLIIIPLRETLVFPGSVTPLSLSRAMNVRALEEALRSERPLGLVTQRRDVEAPAREDLYGIGTVADVVRMTASSGVERQILLQARQRFRVLEITQTEPYFVGRVEFIEQSAPDTPEFKARLRLLREQALHAMALLPQPTPELAKLVENLEDPGLLTDLIASSLDVPLSEKQSVLETLDLESRVQLVADKLHRQIETLALTRKIGAETKLALDREQREYFLREQLRIIRKELGEEDSRAVEMEELRRRIAEARMPEEVNRHAQRELGHLLRFPESSSEHSILRAYLDWLTELPWSVTIEEPIDIARARARDPRCRPP
jgi:ATP-dependent Lon protease